MARSVTEWAPTENSETVATETHAPHLMNKPTTESRFDSHERDRYWRTRLGRLRLGAEPLAAQLERQRRVTWAMTAVSAVIAAMFVTLFTAFRAPLIGLVIASAILGPIVALAWLDFRKLARILAEYEADRQAGDSTNKQAG